MYGSPPASAGKGSVASGASAKHASVMVTPSPPRNQKTLLTLLVENSFILRLTALPTPAEWLAVTHARREVSLQSSG